MSRRDGSVYVGRLAKSTRTRDLEQIFEPYGRLMRCDIKYGSEMAYAFIDFEDRRDAEDCVKYEHGRELNGQSIIVEWAKGGKDRRMQQNTRGRNDSSSQSYDECFRCHRSGHWARDCPDLRWGGGGGGGGGGRRGGGGGRGGGGDGGGGRRWRSPSPRQRSRSRDRKKRSRSQSPRDRRRRSRSRDRKRSSSVSGDRKRSRSQSGSRKSRSGSDDRKKDSRSKSGSVEKKGSRSRSRSKSVPHSKSHSKSPRLQPENHTLQPDGDEVTKNNIEDGEEDYEGENGGERRSRSGSKE